TRSETSAVTVTDPGLSNTNRDALVGVCFTTRSNLNTSTTLRPGSSAPAGKIHCDAFSCTALPRRSCTALLGASRISVERTLPFTPRLHLTFTTPLIPAAIARGGYSIPTTLIGAGFCDQAELTHVRNRTMHMHRSDLITRPSCTGTRKKLLTVP